MAKEIVNRKAKFEYHFLTELEAGIQLLGTEVKSLRLGNANLADAYCLFKNSELYIRNFFIAEYEQAHETGLDTRRERKLLLKKSELGKLERRVREKGLTIVPYKVYFSDRGFVKLTIALAQGKKSFDKRESIKQKDVRRDLDRMKKYR